MFSLAAEHPVLAALALLSVGWVATFLRRGYQVRRIFHDQVRCDQLMWRVVELLTDNGVAGTAALMALGSLEGDGRDDGCE